MVMDFIGVDLYPVVYRNRLLFQKPRYDLKSAFSMKLL